MKRIISIVLIVLMLASLMCGCKKTTTNTPAAPAADAQPGAETPVAADPIKIKITTVQLDAQQMGVAANRLKELVDERLGGKVELLVYTGGQLYSNTEELEALKNGDIQMCLAVGSTMGALDPVMSIFKLPFLFPDVDTAYSVMDGPVGEKIFADIHAQGVNVMGGFSSGSIIISNSAHPIQVPEDIKGLKIRASGKMESAIIDTVGGISTVIPSDETYTALQQKVVDGLATPSTVFAVRKYQEVNKYVTNCGMLYWSNGFILNNDAFWQTLPEDIRTEMEAIVDIVLAETRDIDANSLQDMLDMVASEGCEVHALTPEEIEQWRVAALPVYDQYAEEIGAELVAEVQQAVADFNK